MLTRSRCNASYSVTPAFPQCKVWVRVDGVDTPVYSAKVDGKKISGYIEAREGAAFSVHYRDGSQGRPGRSRLPRWALVSAISYIDM